MSTPQTASSLTRLAQLFDTLPTGLRSRRVRSGPAAHSRADIRFVQVAGCWIRLRQAGIRGPSIVLAADPPVPLELYDHLISRLAAGYRVSVLEMPGFGCSLPNAGFQFSLPSAQAAVTELLEQLPGAPHVLGLPCVTGYVAIALANTRPDLVGRLLLLQTPTWEAGQSWLLGRDPRGLLRTPIIGQLTLALMRRTRIRAWYAAALADRERVPEFAEATLRNFDDGGCFCLASGYQDFLRFHHQRVKPVAQDTLIVWGRADPSHRRTDMAATASLAPHHQKVWFDHAGHFPELEADEAFVAALENFVQPEVHQ